MNHQEQPLSLFLDDLALAAPAPGGGAASALSGALGAALVCMVANLTLSRELAPAAEAELETTRQEAEALRQRLAALMDEDARAYEAVITAYRLPRASAANKAARRQAIEHALQEATLTPLEIAGYCARAVALAEPVARLGLRTAVTDAGAAAYLAEAGAQACLLNVEINLASIRDQSFVTQASEHAADLRARLPALREAALAAMRAALHPQSQGG